MLRDTCGPLISRSEILRRQNSDRRAEHELYQPRGAVRIFELIHDPERLIRRTATDGKSRRDLAFGTNSLAMLPYIKQILKGSSRRAA